MRLLLCDDHRLLLDALSMALTDRGYTVVATALDPDEAVEAARIYQPDASLLDVKFPHANGLSAISRIHEVSPNTKVVMLSGSVNRSLVADTCHPTPTTPYRVDAPARCGRGAQGRLAQPRSGRDGHRLELLVKQRQRAPLAVHAGRDRRSRCRPDRLQVELPTD